MDAFLVSTAFVALAEIGDKTQLLSLVLSARYRRPLPILIGILIATLLNHALASALGAWITSAVAPATLRWLLGLSFIAMAAWMLIPDRLDARQNTATRFGVLGTALLIFFLAEMGDKTQIATVALAAKYGAFYAVVAGSTLGMMIANAPVVWFGDRIANRLPVRVMRLVTMALFAVLGILAIAGPGF